MARPAKNKPYEPGYEGAVEISDPLQITAARKNTRYLRCRPGSFEWRYARRNADLTLYHAGNHYALLWEKAGTADARSPDLKATPGGQWKGLPDGRAVAMDEIRRMFDKERSPNTYLGKAQSARLTAYCVEGKTTAELASQYGIPDRDMAAVLHQDLAACAAHFRFR